MQIGRSRPSAPATAGSWRAPYARRSARLTWIALVAGVALSAGVALQWTTHVAATNRADFELAAEQVAATADATLQRHADLSASFASLVATNPAITNSEFADWYHTLDGDARYPAGTGFALVVPVAANALAEFAAERAADPLNGFPAGEPVVPYPPGERDRYCLMRLAVSIDVPTAGAAAGLPLQDLDFCANQRRPLRSPFEAGLFAARDLGTTTATTMGVDLLPVIWFATPVYRGGDVPHSVAGRRQLHHGWLIAGVGANGLVDTITNGRTDLALSLRRLDPGLPSVVVANGGGAPVHGATTHTIGFEADGAWELTVTDAGAPDGATPAEQGVAILIGGLLITALSFVLLRLLVTSRRRALDLVDTKTDELNHVALHDALTGLPNRTLVLDRAEQMLARSRRRQRPSGAMVVDVDGFKHVNDTFGHEAGDRLLQAVADRLQSALRASDSIGRLGADEFVVLLDDESLDAGPELVAERMLDVLRQPFALDGLPDTALTISVSIGIATGDRRTAADLLRDADIALYRAKVEGKGRHVVFRADMQTAVQDRMLLEMDLREALADDAGQLFLLYQPTFDLDDQSMTGVEALVRWHHPTKGIIGPDRFIPLAEESGLIVPIGRWVLEQACRQAARWHANGRRLQMSVNVSGRQLEHDTFVADVVAAIAESGIDPQSLTVEITETVLMRDVDAIAARLGELKRLGIKIAIDDFGTGYSSLAHLQRFPLDSLKIDRSFVAGINRSAASAAVIHTLVQLGKTLGLETVAEGIEAREELVHLQREGCDRGQGFLFARPLDVATVEELHDINTTTRRAPLTSAPQVAAAG